MIIDTNHYEHHGPVAILNSNHCIIFGDVNIVNGNYNKITGRVKIMNGNHNSCKSIEIDNGRHNSKSISILPFTPNCSNVSNLGSFNIGSINVSGLIDNYVELGKLQENLFKLKEKIDDTSDKIEQQKDDEESDETLDEELDEALDEEGTPECDICMNNKKKCVLGCGHVFCIKCSKEVNYCPNCRAKITSRKKLFL